MPSWKKVIVSGSDTHLNNITASAGIQVDGNITGSITSTGSFGLVELSSNSSANESLLKLNYGALGSTSNHAVLSVNAQGSLRIMSKANNSVFEIGLYNNKQFQFEKYNASHSIDFGKCNATPCVDFENVMEVLLLILKK